MAPSLLIRAVTLSSSWALQRYFLFLSGWAFSPPSVAAHDAGLAFCRRMQCPGGCGRVGMEYRPVVKGEHYRGFAGRILKNYRHGQH